MKIKTITIHNFRSIKDTNIYLGDYSLLVGANNSGKSNIIDAIRVFFEGKDYGLKYDKKRDFPKLDTDNESWIDIEFELIDEEYSNLKDEWRQPANKLRVRKYLVTNEIGSDKKPKSGIYAFTQDNKIADEHFYGAKNVQQGKLGDIMYIPAVSKLDEHTKLSGPSVFRDLLNDIFNKLVKASPSFKNLQQEFSNFSTAFKEEETEDSKSLAGLEEDISSEIEEWDAGFRLLISPINEAAIVKNLISYVIIDKNLNKFEMDASSFGQGFQRHLIFVLIKMAAKYQASNICRVKKEFKPDMMLLLFEEPEAFLHPPQQNVLCQSLKIIGTQADQQTLLSSHSPHFVSHSSEDILSIIRLSRTAGVTICGQIQEDKLQQVFSENQQINSILEGTKYEASIDDLKSDMEAIKYFMWLNPDRCGMFFASHVLLVEGPTEKVLCNYLLEQGILKSPKGGLFILDCMGKFNIHRFMNICGPMCIRHSVLFDADSGKETHQHIQKFIEDSKNDYTVKIDNFTNDIEDFLGIEKCNKPHRKPQHVLLKLKEGVISEEKIESLVKKINDLI